MAYRVLVDENTSPLVAEMLRGSGHEAIHVSRALAVGASDGDVADFAASNEYLVLTHDDDFLRPDVRAGNSVLYYGDDTVGPDVLVSRVAELSALVPDAADLPAVTNLGDWP